MEYPEINFLREKLHYDPQTGKFTWKNHGKLYRYKEAGSVWNFNGSTYKLVGFNFKTYRAHRLAWYYHYGIAPHGDIDHINGDSCDNRIENLRVVSPRQNSQNLKKHREGHLLGTSLHKKKYWKASIWIKGKAIYLGSYSTAEEAHKAYLTALAKLA